jgi:hypothetical protein
MPLTPSDSRACHARGRPRKTPRDPPVCSRCKNGPAPAQVVRRGGPRNSASVERAWARSAPSECRFLLGPIRVLLPRRGASRHKCGGNRPPPCGRRSPSQAPLSYARTTGEWRGRAERLLTDQRLALVASAGASLGGARSGACPRPRVFSAPTEPHARLVPRGAETKHEHFLDGLRRSRHNQVQWRWCGRR